MGTVLATGLALSGMESVLVFGPMGEALFERNRRPLEQFARGSGETLSAFEGWNSHSIVFGSPTDSPERYIGVVYLSPDSEASRLRRGRAVVAECYPFADSPWWPERPIVACDTWVRSGDERAYAQVVWSGPSVPGVPELGSSRPFFVDPDLGDSEILALVDILYGDERTVRDARHLSSLRRSRGGSVVASLQLNSVSRSEVTLGRGAKEGWAILHIALWEQ
jgi:hypothetical protein